jgi:hypothetical protein
MAPEPNRAVRLCLEDLANYIELITKPDGAAMKPAGMHR